MTTTPLYISGITLQLVGVTLLIVWYFVHGLGDGGISESAKRALIRTGRPRDGPHEPPPAKIPVPSNWSDLDDAIVTPDPTLPVEQQLTSVVRVINVRNRARLRDIHRLACQISELSEGMQGQTDEAEQESSSDCPASWLAPVGSAALVVGLGFQLAAVIIG